MCQRNLDNNVLQIDYKAQCNFVRNLIKQKLRHFYQHNLKKIEKEAANAKRSCFSISSLKHRAKLHRLATKNKK